MYKRGYSPQAQPTEITFMLQNETIEAENRKWIVRYWTDERGEYELRRSLCRCRLSCDCLCKSKWLMTNESNDQWNVHYTDIILAQCDCGCIVLYCIVTRRVITDWLLFSFQHWHFLSRSTYALASISVTTYYRIGYFTYQIRYIRNSNDGTQQIHYLQQLRVNPFGERLLLYVFAFVWNAKRLTLKDQYYT